MEKAPSPPPSDAKTASPPPQSPPIDSSPQSDQRNQQFASSFTTLYHSIFPPKPSPLAISLSLTPSTSSPSSSADDFATEHRLHQARLILEYQELYDHYELSLARLRTLTKEIESLRQENADLRLANNDLIKLLSLSSQAAIHSRLNNRDAFSDFPQPTVVDPNRFERRNVPERVLLPKSISVRANEYVKANQAGASNSTRSRPDQHVSGSVQQRVFVAAGGGRREDTVTGGVELEVYNQGMWKTELCNKWQESGTCPYGDHCQFAHGITELRPVIRHPRYKTQVCRMVLAGDACPYGHRCHFRHTLTEQERLMGPR